MAVTLFFITEVDYIFYDIVANLVTLLPLLKGEREDEDRWI
jgi:hypothetical protein